MTRAQFKRQIDWFQKEFDLVSLAELQRRVDSGFNDRPTLAITFDDGYAENCEYALPLLIERKIPVCYFVTIDNIVRQAPFPHDVELGQNLPVNSVESIQILSNSGIEIGAHTRTHIDLGSVSDQALLADEVIQASIEIEEHVGKPVQYFAFPFGQRENLNHGGTKSAATLSISSVFMAIQVLNASRIGFRLIQESRASNLTNTNVGLSAATVKPTQRRFTRSSCRR